MSLELQVISSTLLVALAACYMLAELVRRQRSQSCARCPVPVKLARVPARQRPSSLRVLRGE